MPLFHTAYMSIPDTAVNLTRDTLHFQWYAIPLLLLVLYVYSEQFAEKRYSVVFAGLTFWLMDWVNEIWNALFAHFSGFAPIWGVAGNSAIILLAGLNLEITFMFAIMGVVAVRLLPPDPKFKIFGINNRIVMAAANSVLCVLVEIWLNHIGLLPWHWRYWNAHFPWLIWLIGYLPFFGVAYWVYDMRPLRRQIMVVAFLAVLVALALIVFIGMLGWI